MKPERFTIVLQPLPDATTSGVYRLRRALKCLLRTFGLKCIAAWQGDASASAIAERTIDEPDVSQVNEQEPRSNGP